MCTGGGRGGGGGGAMTLQSSMRERVPSLLVTKMSLQSYSRNTSPMICSFLYTAAVSTKHVTDARTWEIYYFE